MFDPTSRYFSLPTYEVTDGAGRTVRLLKPRMVPDTTGVTTRRITQADRVDLVAYQYYRAPDRFWRIADANGLQDPGESYRDPGDVISIPTSS